MRIRNKGPYRIAADCVVEPGANLYALSDQASDLVDAHEKLGPNARRILLALAERLVKGREHGDFDKPHDWDKESAEEALDLAVYQAAKLLGLGGAMAQSSPELTDAERGRQVPASSRGTGRD